LPPDPGVGPEDWLLTETVMSIWAQFAKTGNPSLPDLKWSAFDTAAGSDKYMDLATLPEVKAGYMGLFH